MTNNPTPLCDNMSGEYCPACRSVSMSHCAHPDNCGNMKPMKHHDKCFHNPRISEEEIQRVSEELRKSLIFKPSRLWKDEIAAILRTLNEEKKA